MTKTDKVSKKAARKQMEKKLEATLGSLESQYLAIKILKTCEARR
jgi:hypothetical protein